LLTETTEYRARETAQFFYLTMTWPTSYPDLNPVIYAPVMPRRLTQRLVEEWPHFSQDIIDRAVRQWRVRLLARVRENGGHF